jgi:hypothetical protein
MEREEAELLKQFHGTVLGEEPMQQYEALQVRWDSETAMRWGCDETHRRASSQPRLDRIDPNECGPSRCRKAAVLTRFREGLA